MRIKTVKGIVDGIKKVDSESAINQGIIRLLFEQGELKSFSRGNRIVSDMDQVVEDLNRIYNIDEKDSIPRIRSIRNAFGELRTLRPELGISEEGIRFLVTMDYIPHIDIGNRSYVALECFEPPYDQCLINFDYRDARKKERERIFQQTFEAMGLA